MHPEPPLRGCVSRRLSGASTPPILSSPHSAAVSCAPAGPRASLLLSALGTAALPGMSRTQLHPGGGLYLGGLADWPGWTQ